MHITRKFGIIAAVPAALVLGAAGAYAATTSSSSPIDSSGVIHGCYASRAIRGSHTVTLQNAGTGCSRGATAVTWNQKGATGPVGPKGPAGATTAGPSGLDVITVTDSFAGDSGEAVCPSSHPYVLGGGGQSNRGNGSLTNSVPQVGASGGAPTVPVIPPGWDVTLSRPGGIAYAVCVK